MIFVLWLIAAMILIPATLTLLFKLEGGNHEGSM